MRGESKSWQRQDHGKGDPSPVSAGTNPKSAREQALCFLEYADRTEKELDRKLTERGYAPEEIQDAMGFLREYRYLDDDAYAKRYVRSRAARKSRRQIRAELEQKGIAGRLIEAALEEEPVDEEGQIRRFLEKKGCHPGEEPEPRQLRRLSGALARKGYSFEQIRNAISPLCTGDRSGST